MKKNNSDQDLIQELIQTEEQDFMQAEAIERLRFRILKSLKTQSKSASLFSKIRWLIPAGVSICLAAVILYLILPSSSLLEIPSHDLKSFLENNPNIKTIFARDEIRAENFKQDEFTDDDNRLSNFILAAMINTSQTRSLPTIKPDSLSHRKKISAAENLEKIKILIQENSINDFFKKFTSFKEEKNDSKNLSHSSIYWINHIQYTCI